jgi:hypothetical protein
MTELEILNLQAASIQATGLYFVGMAFTIWVAFRVSSVVSQRTPDNIVMKAVASVFGICVVYYFNMVGAYQDYNTELAGHRLASLKASGGDVSQSSMDFVALIGASTTPPTFTLVPADPIQYVFMAAVLAIILLPLWGPKQDA